MLVSRKYKNPRTKHKSPMPKTAMATAAAEANGDNNEDLVDKGDLRQWLSMPGFVFLPSDEDLVVHYLLPRLRGLPLPCDGVILDADPYGAAPMDLLAMHGKRDDAFFLAKKRRARRAGNGTWKIQKSTGGSAVTDDGEHVAWRKELLLFYLDDYCHRSSGWTMYEYKVTDAFPAACEFVLCEIRMSGSLKKSTKRKESESEDATGVLDMVLDAGHVCKRRAVVDSGDAVLGQVLDVGYGQQCPVMVPTSANSLESSSSSNGDRDNPISTSREQDSVADAEFANFLESILLTDTVGDTSPANEAPESSSNDHLMQFLQNLPDVSVDPWMM